MLKYKGQINIQTSMGRYNSIDNTFNLNTILFHNVENSLSGRALCVWKYFYEMNLSAVHDIIRRKKGNSDNKDALGALRQTVILLVKGQIEKEEFDKYDFSYFTIY